MARYMDENETASEIVDAAYQVHTPRGEWGRQHVQSMMRLAPSRQGAKMLINLCALASLREKTNLGQADSKPRQI